MLENALVDRLGADTHLELLDQKTYETLQRLLNAGVVQLAGDRQTLYRSATLEQAETEIRAEEHKRRLNEAR